MTNNTTPQPWQQQPQESDLLYSYFQIYKDIPTHIRTIKKVKETLHQHNKEITYEYLRVISAEHKWQDRVSAWDKHTHSLVLKGTENSIQEMNNRQADIASDVIELIYSELTDEELKSVDKSKRAYVIQALIRGLEGGVRIQRLAMGESTSNTRQVNEGINNIMMVLNESKKELQKRNNKQEQDVIDIEYKKK